MEYPGPRAWIFFCFFEKRVHSCLRNDNRAFHNKIFIKYSLSVKKYPVWVNKKWVGSYNPNVAIQVAD